MVAARRSLDELYRSHAAEVYRYAYAVLGNHADAEDVTQTTFVNALRALERGERPRKPSNWLITITHNIVRQRFRQQQARPTEVELIRDVAEEAVESSGPSMEELVRALQRIPQSQREALVLRELEGRSYDQIAETLNLTKGALETLLFRARRSLADELENAATCDRAELEPLAPARRPACPGRSAGGCSITSPNARPARACRWPRGSSVARSRVLRSSPSPSRSRSSRARRAHRRQPGFPRSVRRARGNDGRRRRRHRDGRRSFARRSRGRRRCHQGGCCCRGRVGRRRCWPGRGARDRAEPWPRHVATSQGELAHRCRRPSRARQGRGHRPKRRRRLGSTEREAQRPVRTTGKPRPRRAGNAQLARPRVHRLLAM